MKKLLFVMLVLLLVVPATNSFSASFQWASIWSENRYWDDTNLSEYFMEADAGVDTNAHNVFVNIPSWAGSSYPGGEYQKLNIQPWFGNYDAYKYFKTADGYPSPGNAYETIDFKFFIDTNNNGALDLSDQRPTPDTLNYDSGTFSQLSLVDNVNVSYVGSNVSASWNGIPMNVHPNSQYRVRVIDQNTNEFYYASPRIDIDASNFYELDIDVSSWLDKDLYIAIEAREGVGDTSMANRSRYYASANPVPEPTTMLLFGAGLVGLAGFGRKKFKK